MAESLLHLLRDLIGVPFVDGGRDRKGLDCWGLVMLAMLRAGKQIPDYNVNCHEREKIAKLVADPEQWVSWKKIDDPMPGDGIALRVDPNMPDAIQHFGVYLGSGKFIHTTRKTGVMVSRITDPMWRGRIEGYYRW